MTREQVDEIVDVPGLIDLGDTILYLDENDSFVSRIVVMPLNQRIEHACA
jgi:hypothetical protein